jgi:hypothetical protein
VRVYLLFGRGPVVKRHCLRLEEMYAGDGIWIAEESCEDVPTGHYGCVPNAAMPRAAMQLSTLCTILAVSSAAIALRVGI